MIDEEVTGVDLGFFERDFDQWETQSRQFPSKIGGSVQDPELYHKIIIDLACSFLDNENTLFCYQSFQGKYRTILTNNTFLPRKACLARPGQTAQPQGNAMPELFLTPFFPIAGD